LILLDVPPRRGPKRKDREIGRVGRPADVERLSDSEMAPQAIEMAQNGLG